VDVEAAALAIDEAEGALRAGDCRTAWGHANVAVAIARRTFLPGDEGDWIDGQRRRLHEILVRGLDCLSELSLRNGEGPLAAQHAAEAVALEPFRETGYQRLMRAHAASGNRAEAIRVYERCRVLLAGELGAAPSQQTEAAYRDLLNEA
jgi:DNA-binding SARP family transcriptional activator